MISANTLFHFTSKFDYLEMILTKGYFSPRICVEHFDFEGNTSNDLPILMVCFCDIPLSQINSHTNQYGGYAIGLTKNWGIKNKITPILYVHKKAKTLNLMKIFDISSKLLTELFQNKSISPKTIGVFMNFLVKKYSPESITKLQYNQPIFNAYLSYFAIDQDESKLRSILNKEYGVEKTNELLCDIQNYKSDKEEVRNLFAINLENKKSLQYSYDYIAHTKPYEGKMWQSEEGRYVLKGRKDNKDEPIRFYDEREWRYTPPLDIAHPIINGAANLYSIFSEHKGYLEDNNYLIYKRESKILNDDLENIEDARLKFTVDDIKYLIISDEKDRLNLIKTINGLELDDDKKAILTSKILTLQQIEEDF